MARKKRVLEGVEEIGTEDMAMAKGKRGKGKKKHGFRPVSKATGTRRRKGRVVLKKGCKWGRGRYKGKVLCRIGKAA